MLTIDDARAVFEQYVHESPLPLFGTLYVEGWLEDADDFLPIWGAREYYVDGVEGFARMDNLVVFVDKRTGEVRREDRFANIRKTGRMTPVVTAPEPDAG